MTAPATPPLLRQPAFLALLLARVVSVLGNGFARVALAFAVLGLPGTGPGTLSLVLACQALPQLAFVLFGGVLADRMARARVMMSADVVGAGAYAALAALVLADRAPVPALCALAVVAGSATALFAPAMEGIVPLLVERDRLQRANGLLRMATNTSLVLGLALSGVTVALVGAGWALALNAASFVVSAALTALLPTNSRTAKRRSGWAELREGWREFAGRQWLWAVVCQFTVVVAALNAFLGVLGPLVAEERHGGARAWSLLVAAQALGTVAGAGLAARLRVRRPVLVAVLATFPYALPLLLLGTATPLWVTACAMFVSGVTGDVFAVLWSTTIQQRVPEAALSRVASYDLFGSLAFAPLGLLCAGPLAQLTGTSGALVGCGAAIVLATSAALLAPQVRALTTLPTAPGPGPATGVPLRPSAPATEASPPPTETAT
ncbi:MFS transporter [Streptomyces sp. NA04227]|uniref:MFS transporter n=1 Tax=Streptomyces sp. NA04227 TaxID=2742136 RepID=UPI001592A27E|nr:MFS transporter [Streptomyces sp. NA04227]QKW05326.1 MFS transporter [Streptomyces sp. NA04227]